MAIKKFKPITPGRRQMAVSAFAEITKDEPEKSLLAPLKKRAGRNHQGRITVRHRGGGHKRRYRLIDFKRDKDGVPAKVAAIEYDPIAPISLSYTILTEKKDIFYLPMASRWGIRFIQEKMPISRWAIACL